MKPTFELILCSIAVLAMPACAQERQSKTKADLTEKMEPLLPPSAELAALSGFAGTYVIVDARRASDVAVSGIPGGLGQESPIGKTITFTRTGIEMEGASCDEWKITPTDNAVLYPQTDPNLLDLVLGPNVGVTVGDQQEHTGFDMICEGERFGQLHKVDDRVLVMPWDNSATNLILEKQLPTLKIKAYQAQLKSMKFYDGGLTGELDAATLKASRIYYEYRARLDDTQPIPARPAITENLLDGLHILY